MKTIYERPSEALQDADLSFCGGCGHGIVHKLLAEVLQEHGLVDDTIILWPIGCSMTGSLYLNTDNINALHGKAPAMATGVKRAVPESLVITYQGDGDLIAEGIAEIFSATARGEDISVIFINNANYGMTGGQQAPTTMVGQVTSTTPYGRSAETNGYPINAAEMLAMMPGCIYSERVTVTNPANVAKVKKAIEKALLNQWEGKHGLSFVEVLSPCPTNWKMAPLEALQFIDDVMTKQYPLGVFKDMDAPDAVQAFPPINVQEEVAK